MSTTGLNITYCCITSIRSPWQIKKENKSGNLHHLRLKLEGPLIWHPGIEFNTIVSFQTSVCQTSKSLFRTRSSESSDWLLETVPGGSVGDRAICSNS